MLQSLLSHVFGEPDSPTADLYFRNACSDFIGSSVEQIAPTVFASDTACLVMRHWLRAGRLPPRRRLIYLIDDDVDAGATDESLPFLYRQKLKMVEAAAGRRIRRFAGVAVVSSPALARIFQPMMETHLLRPYWSEAFAPLDHFAGCAMTDIAYLGSAAHRADLAFLLPVIRRLLADTPTVRFNLGNEHRLPGDLENHPRVRRIPRTNLDRIPRRTGPAAVPHCALSVAGHAFQSQPFTEQADRARGRRRGTGLFGQLARGAPRFCS